MFFELSAHFEQEVLDREGTIVEDFREAEFGYLSAMLSHSFQIQQGDSLRAGLALKREQDIARLYVMTHRKVCMNGAITTSLVKEKAIHTVEDLHQALQLAFSRIAPIQLREQGRQYQLLLDQPIDEDRLTYAMQKVRMILMKGEGLPSRFFSKLQADQRAQRDQMFAFLRRFLTVERNRPVHRRRHQGTNTHFELVNAITHLAHEIPESNLRWELMELGGELLHSWGQEVRRANWRSHLSTAEKETSTEEEMARQLPLANA